MDVQYVDTYSLFFDLKILWRTIIKVVKREGISQKGYVSTIEFFGNNNEKEKP